MRLLGFLCSPKKVLRFPIQDTHCKTQGSKFCWANFTFCSFWGRSHLNHCVDQTESLCPLQMVAGLSGDYFSRLTASGEKSLCREQEWWGKGSDELSVLGVPHCCCGWHCWARVEQLQCRVVPYMYLHFSCQISYWARITFQWFVLLKEIKGPHFFPGQEASQH